MHQFRTAESLFRANSESRGTIYRALFKRGKIEDRNSRRSGDFEAHATRLRELGAETLEVRTIADLEQCDGLILPAVKAQRNSNFSRKKASTTPFETSQTPAAPFLAPAQGQSCSLT